MARVIADHIINYKGKYFPAGKEFEIEDSDISYLKKAGCLILHNKEDTSAESKRGRPRKQS